MEQKDRFCTPVELVIQGGLAPPLNYTKYRLLLLSDSKIDFLKHFSERLFCGRLEAFLLLLVFPLLG